MKIAIIGGTGKMGRWCARYLKNEGHEIVITGRSEEKLTAAVRELGVRAASNTEAVRQADVTILSLPIGGLEAVANEIAPAVRPGQIIIDITSIKAQPLATLHRYLNECLVLGIHPMFGPGANGISNQNFVLTPTSPPEESLAQKVRDYLVTRQARVTIMTPEEHDRLITVVLGLSHFIAIVAADTLESSDLEKTRAVSSTTYKLLLTMVSSVLSEDPEFYSRLQMSFPDITRVETDFLEKSRLWAKLVADRDQAGFAKRMRDLKERFEKNDPDFQNAYREMYHIADSSELK
jgi:prephenate dehydrogenase